MPNQPPLNPDALEVAVTALDALNAYSLNLTLEDAAEVSIRTYLAAAQPVVNSVEELDALPDDTLLEASGTVRGGKFIQSTIRKLPGYVTDADEPTFELLGYLSSELVHKVALPARVLYRPEVNDA